jgi:hypothetical protein
MKRGLQWEPGMRVPPEHPNRDDYPYSREGSDAFWRDLKAVESKLAAAYALTKPGVTIGHGVENRFTEPVADGLPMWLRRKLGISL